MKNLSQWAWSLIAVGVFAHANASTITISTGYSAAGAQTSAAAYKSEVDAAVARPTMFLDGVALDVGSNDLWWNGNDNNSNGVLSGSGTLAAGNHTLSIYGLESCCGSYQQAQFKAGNSSFASVSSTDGLASVSPVPELSIYAMLLAGLGLLAFTTGQKQPEVFRS